MSCQRSTGYYKANRKTTQWKDELKNPEKSKMAKNKVFRARKQKQ